MKTKKLITLALAGLMVSSLTATVWAEAPKMKMTTPIPPEIYHFFTTQITTSGASAIRK